MLRLGEARRLLAQAHRGGSQTSPWVQFEAAEETVQLGKDRLHTIRIPVE